MFEQDIEHRDHAFRRDHAQIHLVVAADDGTALGARVFRSHQAHLVAVHTAADETDGLGGRAEALAFAAGDADGFGQVAPAQFFQFIDEFGNETFRVRVGQAAGVASDAGSG